eukprot:12542498-Prorocentrum_lima.AAC.1
MMNKDVEASTPTPQWGCGNSRQHKSSGIAERKNICKPRSATGNITGEVDGGVYPSRIEPEILLEERCEWNRDVWHNTSPSEGSSMGKR